MSEIPSVAVFLTEAEVWARYRGTVSRGTLRNWRALKLGPPFVKVGRGVLYPEAGLRAWEADNLVRCGEASS